MDFSIDFKEIGAPDLRVIGMDSLNKSLMTAFTILLLLLLFVEMLNILEMNMRSCIERKAVIFLEANMYSLRDIGKSVLP